MKNLVLVAVAIGFTFFTIVGQAQTQPSTDQKECKAKTEKCDKDKKCNKDKCAGKEGTKCPKDCKTDKK